MNNTVEDIIRVDSNHEILEEWNERVRQFQILEPESNLRRFKKMHEKLEKYLSRAEEDD